MSSCPRCSAALTTTSSSAVSQRTLERPFKKRLLLVTLQSHPKVPTLRCQASGIRGFPTADVPLASIDVEFAHFLNSGKITTAAAEVCLLRDSGAVLLHSYISPGEC